MSLPEMRRPAAGNGEARNRNHNNLRLISRNTNPRQRWTGKPPLKPVAVSFELQAYFDRMAREGGNG
jgi:hypothetical protein